LQLKGGEENFESEAKRTKFALQNFPDTMAYVPVPKDLSKVKTKIAFNLTKRQLVCFSIAGAIGLPGIFLHAGSLGQQRVGTPDDGPYAAFLFLGNV